MHEHRAFQGQYQEDLSLERAAHDCLQLMQVMMALLSAFFSPYCFRCLNSL
jgi:hypothetical protein